MTNYIQYKSIKILNSKYKIWFTLFLYFCIILTCNIFLNENLAFLMQEDSQEESLITEVTRLKNKNIYLRNKLMKANEVLRAQPDVEVLEQELELSQAESKRLNIESSHIFARMAELEEQIENIKVENRNLLLEKSQIETKKNVLENIIRNHILDNSSTTKLTLIRRKTH